MHLPFSSSSSRSTQRSLPSKQGGTSSARTDRFSFYPGFSSLAQGALEEAQFLKRKIFGDEPFLVVSRLCRAASNGDLNSISKLTDHCSSETLNSLGWLGWTPLQKAAENGHAPIVRRLLERGANVDVADDDLQTALHFAASGGHLECAQVLLRSGAEADVRTRDGLTPLFLAVINGHLPMVKLLLATKHVEVNVVADQEQMTPLHAALASGFDRIAQELLSAGADPEARDFLNQTPMDYASQKNQLKSAIQKMVDCDLNDLASGNVADHSAASPAAVEGEGRELERMLEREQTHTKIDDKMSELMAEIDNELSLSGSDDESLAGDAFPFRGTLESKNRSASSSSSCSNSDENVTDVTDEDSHDESEEEESLVRLQMPLYDHKDSSVSGET